MNPDLRALIADASELTGAAAPDFLNADSPTFSPISAGALYYIGIIGGKDVGKSSLVNALAGHAIAEITSHGEGTGSVLAYVHRSHCAEVLEYLRSNIDQHAAVVPHDLPHLLNQVLLDLPDIDSLHDAHIAITRRALRHLLFPIWAQSVEKYADLAPRRLLAAVAAGNDPANFTFVLTKADQLHTDAMSLSNLHDDYARRIANTLQLSAPPCVYLTSATQLADFDLPLLREKLAREKPATAVTQATSLALARQDRSALGWLDSLNLADRAARLARLEEDARERLIDRLARPILDPAIAALHEDPGPRSAAADEALARRAAHWPLLGLIHISLAPISMMLRRFASPPATTSALVDFHLPAAELSAALQTTFAQLESSYPGLSDHPRGKLWESMPADQTIAELRHALAQALDLRRRTAIDLAGRASRWLAPLRWLLTIGALLWFPLAQPILEAFLQNNHATTRQLALTFVQMLSVAHLLGSLTFLIGYFLILYLVIRRSGHRSVGRLFARWDGASDASMSLSKCASEWIEQLTSGIATERAKLEALVERAKSLRKP
jgi:hypothetical protein